MNINNYFCHQIKNCKCILIILVSILNVKKKHNTIIYETEISFSYNNAKTKIAERQRIIRAGGYQYGTMYETHIKKIKMNSGYLSKHGTVLHYSLGTNKRVYPYERAKNKLYY